ncbi:MAG TPA: glucokinase, partial [Allosphingosinicella sp.]|nr:glucokinase [Allosphingosinicella sp.]
MTEIVAADIGGTHARFAIADVEDGRARHLGQVCTLKTSEHAGFEAAWERFRE